MSALPHALHVEKETLRNLAGPELHLQTGLEPLNQAALVEIKGGSFSAVLSAVISTVAIVSAVVTGNDNGGGDGSGNGSSSVRPTGVENSGPMLTN